MLLKKTDKARDALAQQTSASLTVQQRRILILTDGKRSLNELMTLLGKDIVPAVDFLLKQGYITTLDELPAPPNARAGAFGGLLRAAADAINSRGAGVGRGENIETQALGDSVARPRSELKPLQTAVPASVPSFSAASATVAKEPGTHPPPTQARRSLAASKMYVLDILQLQRDVRMAELRSEIQCAQGEVQTIVAMLDALREMMQHAAPSLSSRVLSRLEEILPEDFLPALCGLQSELTGKPVLAINNAA